MKVPCGALWSGDLACVIFGKSYSEVARAEGVHESAVRRSVERGLEKMKQYLKKCL